MDTYLYGLLGLSLAANAFSAISTLVANSKKRDDENQRTIASIYEEMNHKIDTLHNDINDINDRICGLEENFEHTTDLLDSLEDKTMSENFEHTADLLDSLEEEVYNYRPYDLDDADKVTCCKSKKRN